MNTPLPVTGSGGNAGSVRISGFEGDAAGLDVSVVGGLALLVFLAAAYVFGRLGAKR